MSNFSSDFDIDTYLVEHLEVGIVLHDAHSVVIRANRKAQDLLARNLLDMVGVAADDPQWSFVNRDGSRMPQSEYPANHAINTLQPVSNVVLGIKPGEEHAIRWLICNAFPVFDEESELQRVVVSFTDCTDEIVTQNALAMSEEQLRLVLLGSNDGYWDWDLVAGTIFYSPRWWTMLGLTPGSRPSTPSLWCQLLHPNEIERVQAFLHDQLHSASTSYTIEFKLKHSDGHDVSVVSKAFIVRNSKSVAIRIAGTNTDLSERKALEHQLEVNADHDYLTGLPNRRYLMRSLEKMVAHASRASTGGAVFLIDLDHFKLLNDTEGHAAGDILLREVAGRLERAVRASDFVCRLGGDEFVVLMQSNSPHSESWGIEASNLARKLKSILSIPYVDAKRAYSLTPSVGITLFGGGCDSGCSDGSAEIFLQQADIALYAAKSDGRNTVRFFDLHMQDLIDERVKLQSELSKAINNRELLLYYQPIFDANRHVTGAEALIRWDHPTRGLLPPSVFIPIAETSDLILSVGRWVLNTACAKLQEWATCSELATLTLAINVSARQLSEADFVSTTLSTIAGYEINPIRLGMELTETNLTANIESTISKMTALSESGIKFSIDDFGTGFSSLQYIHRYPVDKLKIDQSFVATCHTEKHSTTIVEIVIALAEKLRIGNIAEGVETEEQLAYLIQLGCSSFQGFLLSRPLPAEQFEGLVLTASRGQ